MLKMMERKDNVRGEFDRPNSLVYQVNIISAFDLDSCLTQQNWKRLHIRISRNWQYTEFHI